MSCFRLDSEGSIPLPAPYYLVKENFRMKKLELTESVKKLLENNYNNFEEFLSEIRDNTFNFYMNLINKLEDFRNKNLEKYQELSKEDYKYWNEFVNLQNNICNDYDVTDFIYNKERYSEEKALNHLNYIIDEHIKKLSKSVTKEIGNVSNIDEIESNTYKLTGEKGTCTLTVTPIKLSSTNSVIKTRFKISNIELTPVVTKDWLEDETNDLIKQWKQQELQGYLDYNERFWNRYIQLKDELKTLEYTSDSYKEKEKDVQYYKGNNSFFYQYGKDDNFKERCQKEVDNHFRELQSRVEKYIGRIINIKSLGGNDYWFEGKNGTCTIEVIWAGGYNIQRLHTRWIVRNVQNNKEE